MNNLEKLAGKYLPVIPLLAALSFTAYASGKDRDVPLPNLALTQYSVCEVNDDPIYPGQWRVTAKAYYYQITGTNADIPSWKIWISTRKKHEKAIEDCKEWIKFANEKIREHRKTKEKNKETPETIQEK